MIKFCLMPLLHSWLVWPAMTFQLLIAAGVTKPGFRNFFHVEILIPLVFKGKKKKIPATRAPLPKNFTVA